MHNYYEYADSLKIRQYAFFGLPIISEGFTPTSVEARNKKCCLIFKNINDLSEKIKLLFQNQKLFKEMSKNSIQWAQENNKEKFIAILEKKIRTMNN